jgi:hypothetical protein
MRVRSHFFLTILSSLFLSYASNLFSIENNQEESLTNLSSKQDRALKRAAVCYWGLTRSTKKVFQSHFNKLFNQLKMKGVEFDVFMHTWRLNGKQRIEGHEIKKPIDYEEYKLLKPDFYRIDDQDEFINNLALDLYIYPEVDNSAGFWKPWDNEYINKVILNHICALESLKRVTEMMQLNGIHYDYIFYVRPDSKFKDKFPVENLTKLEDGVMIIPNDKPFGGYNDRFAVLNFNTAPIYGKRIDGLAEFRRIKGYIHSERYLYNTCIDNGLKVIEVQFPFDTVRP